MKTALQMKVKSNKAIEASQVFRDVMQLADSASEAGAYHIRISPDSYPDIFKTLRGVSPLVSRLLQLGFHVGHNEPNDVRTDFIIKDVAKLIRKDLKKAFTPSTQVQKISVTISRYAGGQSLYVRLTLSARGLKMKDAIQKRAQDIVDSYNYDGSNVQYDYHAAKFYGFVFIHPNDF